MTKKLLELEDIADQITDLGTLISDQISGVDNKLSNQITEVDNRLSNQITEVDNRLSNQITGVDKRLSSHMSGLERKVASLAEWLGRIDSHLMGVESDIKEIYQRIVILEAKHPHLKQAEYEELENKLAKLINWAKAVSKQTGVPLPPIT